MSLIILIKSILTKKKALGGSGLGIQIILVSIVAIAKIMGEKPVPLREYIPQSTEASVIANA